MSKRGAPDTSDNPDRSGERDRLTHPLARWEAEDRRFQEGLERAQKRWLAQQQAQSQLPVTVKKEPESDNAAFTMPAALNQQGAVVTVKKEAMVCMVPVKKEEASTAVAATLPTTHHEQLMDGVQKMRNAAADLRGAITAAQKLRKAPIDVQSWLANSAPSACAQQLLQPMTKREGKAASTDPGPIDMKWYNALNAGEKSSKETIDKVFSEGSDELKTFVAQHLRMWIMGRFYERLKNLPPKQLVETYQQIDIVNNEHVLGDSRKVEKGVDFRNRKAHLFVFAKARSCALCTLGSNVEFPPCNFPACSSVLCSCRSGRTRCHTRACMHASAAGAPR